MPGEGAYVGIITLFFRGGEFNRSFFPRLNKSNACDNGWIFGYEAHLHALLSKLEGGFGNPVCGFPIAFDKNQVVNHFVRIVEAQPDDGSWFYSKGFRAEAKLAMKRSEVDVVIRLGRAREASPRIKRAEKSVVGFI